MSKLDAMKKEAGYTLIELIAAMVLVGIISSMASLFLIAGLNGYLFATKSVGNAIKAQTAMARIGLELRGVSNITAPFITDTLITYTHDELPGARKIVFDSGSEKLYIEKDSTRYLLLDNVSGFTLSAINKDLDNDGGNEIAYIEIGFTITGITDSFSQAFSPRKLIDEI